jgi:hypothetical protein
MTIHDLMASPELQEAYRKWVNDPMTKMAQELLLQEGRPRIMPFGAISGEVALELHGESAGWYACCDRMITLDQVDAPTQEPEVKYEGADNPKK